MIMVFICLKHFPKAASFATNVKGSSGVPFVQTYWEQPGKYCIKLATTTH